MNDAVTSRLHEEYDKGGQSAVYDYVNSTYPDWKWGWCEGCDCESPAMPDDGLCAVCWGYKIDNTTCPSCGGGIPNEAYRGQYPGAISRIDNKTEICSNCGADEAIEQWLTGTVNPERLRKQ